MFSLFVSKKHCITVSVNASRKMFNFFVLTSLLLLPLYNFMIFITTDSNDNCIKNNLYRLQIYNDDDNDQHNKVTFTHIMVMTKKIESDNKFISGNYYDDNLNMSAALLMLPCNSSGAKYLGSPS